MILNIIIVLMMLLLIFEAVIISISLMELQFLIALGWLIAFILTDVCIVLLNDLGEKK